MQATVIARYDRDTHRKDDPLFLLDVIPYARCNNWREFCLLDWPTAASGLPILRACVMLLL